MVCCFLEITLPFLVMEAEVRGERRYYCIPEHHSWPEKWICYITAGQEGPLCSGCTSQEHQCSGTSSLWSFGLEFTPSRYCLGQKPMSAPAGGCLWGATSLLQACCLGLGSPCHPGRTAGHCSTAGCPHASINAAIIQHKVLAIVFSRPEDCPDNNLNTNLASCS